MLKKIKFTYDELKSFLNYLKKIAPFILLKEYKHKEGIILRHDVDFYLLPAYNMAKIEKELDIVSTFFIRTTCHTYNPFSSTNRKIITYLNDNGFEIGLHFDPIVYGDIDHNELKEKVDAECGILESIIHRPVTSVSLHNPSIGNRYPMFKEYNNAYSKDIFSDDCYLSDSCMNFRGKNLYDFVKKAKDSTLQVVLHPMHWSETGGNYIAIFDRYIHNLIDYIDDVYMDNNTYKECILDNKLVNCIPIKGEEKT